jgi:DNA adenine methylase
MRTFASYQGNKTRLLKHIIPLVPEFDRYIEPFGGSGAVLLKLEPKTWIYNDLNQDIYNIFIGTRDSCDTLVEIFKDFGEMFKPMDLSMKKMYCKALTSCIDTFDTCDINRTAFYILMCYCSFMGVIVRNNEYKFTGLNNNIFTRDRYQFLTEDYYTNLRMASKFLKTGKIRLGCYKNILSECRKGDFVFLDPPYIEEHDYQFNYNKGEILKPSFLYELLEQISRLDSLGVKWMMTQAETSDVLKMFEKYYVTKVPVYRYSKKCFVNELLIMNY